MTINDDEATTQRQEEPSLKKTVMGRGAIEQFDNLLIRALFADNIKSHVADDDRERVFEEIRAVCLTRGLTEFVHDLKVSSDSFVDVLTSYGANVATYMQSVVDSLHEAEQEGNATSPGEQALIKFFRDRGIQPRLVSEERVGGANGFLDGLRKYAVRNGIDEDTFNELVVMVDEEDEEDDRDECDCPYHRVQHAMRNAVTKQCGIKQERNQDGYSIVCPEHGRVYLSNTEYTEQLLDPDKGWFCTRCDAKSVLYEEEDDAS